MPTEMELRCRCGEVVGRVENASPQKVNRVVCYCDDCQAFAHQLGRADLLNAQGGTDVVQVAPASVTFVKGQQHIAGLRLSPKGLLRFHATCCNTPVGNTLSPAIPFVGIVAQVIDASPENLDSAFGPPVGAIFGKFAVGKPPSGSTGPNLLLLLRAIAKLLGWRFGGRVWPHPFFKPQTREPVYPVTVLTREQREALRPLCGPKPA
jgi:hypothetical protein